MKEGRKKRKVEEDQVRGQARPPRFAGKKPHPTRQDDFLWETRFLKPSVIVFIFILRLSYLPAAATIKGKLVSLAFFMQDVWYPHEIGKARGLYKAEGSFSLITDGFPFSFELEARPALV